MVHELAKVSSKIMVRNMEVRRETILEERRRVAEKLDKPPLFGYPERVRAGRAYTVANST